MNIYHLEPMYRAVSEVLHEWCESCYPIFDKDAQEIVWDLLTNDREYDFDTKTVVNGWTIEDLTNCVILFKSRLTSQ